MKSTSRPGVRNVRGGKTQALESNRPQCRFHCILLLVYTTQAVHACFLTCAMRLTVYTLQVVELSLLKQNARRSN